MPYAILPATVAIPRCPAAANRTLSSARSLSFTHQFPLNHPLSASSRSSPRELVIRMGGGPRTFPGGVSKWQWKRMQAKKAKQLLKARLCRERQLYEMRKRTELRAAASELERPWEVVERAPKLFSVSADEQLKALADRFQRPGGFDMWNERDGPQVFHSPVDGLPSTRFFPKGVVHSVKPYSVAGGPGEDREEERDEELKFNDWIARAGGVTRRRRSRRNLNSGVSQGTVEEAVDVEAKFLDEGTDQRDQNVSFSSKNSRTPRHLSNRFRSATENWKNQGTKHRDQSVTLTPRNSSSQRNLINQYNGTAGDWRDEGADQSDGSVSFSSWTSRSSRNLSYHGPHGNGAGKDRRVSLLQGGATNSNHAMWPDEDGLVESSRNRGNSRKQRFSSQFGRNEFNRTAKNLNGLSVSSRNHGNGGNQGFDSQFKSNVLENRLSRNIEMNKIRSNRTVVKHGNGRNQGFDTQSKSNVLDNSSSSKVQMNKIRRNRRLNISSARLNRERITLRPTSELLNRKAATGGKMSWRRETMASEETP